MGQIQLNLLHLPNLAKAIQYIQFSISAGASQADRKKLDASRALSFGVHASSVILLNAGPNDTLLPLKGIG
jgi:hypothetical protein